MHTTPQHGAREETETQDGFVFADQGYGSLQGDVETGEVEDVLCEMLDGPRIAYELQQYGDGEPNEENREPLAGSTDHF